MARLNETRAMKLERLRNRYREVGAKMAEDYDPHMEAVADRMLEVLGNSRPERKRREAATRELPAEYALLAIDKDRRLVIHLQSGRPLGMHVAPGPRRQVIEDSKTKKVYHYQPLTEAQRKRFSKLIRTVQKQE